MTTHRPLLSAHRGGACGDPLRENTLGALLEAVTLDCEFVELDVQRCRDGVHVLAHDDDVFDGSRWMPIRSLTADEYAALPCGGLLLEEALEALRGRKKVHLDLKRCSDPDDGGPARRHEVALIARVVEVMGAGAVVVTGLDDEAVAAVRAWSRSRHPELLVGFALGRDLVGLPPGRLVRSALGDLFPDRRLRRCDANLVVCEKTLAKAWIAAWARRRGLPLLVWTVDDTRELRSWLDDSRAWLITTNFPRRASRVRRDLDDAA
jgi:glycerophosphoryl diester phosphodiesterase